MNTCILIQGPTTYLNQIVECYAKFPNVYWTTWIGDEKRKKLGNINMNYIEMPKERGSRNVNLQCISTIKGMELVKDKGFKYFIKIRSDIIIRNFDKLLNHLEKNYNNKISVICPQNLKYHAGIDSNGCMLVDYITFGNYDNIYNLWNYYEETPIAIPTELKITYKYLDRKDAPPKEIYNKYFDGFLNYIVKNDIDLIWLSKKDPHNKMFHPNYPNCVYINKYYGQDYYEY